MKIERLNDDQIRCTLTRGDLIQRNLTLHKLTAGSPEARELFREMIERSSEEVGFEVGERPIMVEAAALAEGSLILTITRLEGQEGNGRPEGNARDQALRTAMMRMLQLAAAEQEKNNAPKTGSTAAAAPGRSSAPEAAKTEKGKEKQSSGTAVFAFYYPKNLEALRNFPEAPKGVRSALYYQPKSKLYYLVLQASPSKLSALEQLACRLGEYGRRMPSSDATEAYYQEHYETIFRRNALEELRKGMQL